MQHPVITIKLLHERRSTNRRRKVDGRSGKMYVFLWNEHHKAYCFTTGLAEEVDDLFNGQGRVMGSYFAPVIEEQAPEAPPAELAPDLILGLLERGIDLPKTLDGDSVARALLAAYDRGQASSVQATAAETPPAPEQPAKTPRKAKAKADAPAVATAA